MPFLPFVDREAALRRLGSESFDLAVVGGGISGAGIALEATLRGYRCALVEANDFAGGTSSRSTKLVHGGLRYLERGEVEFVRASLEERAFLLRHAPDLVRPLPHLMPLDAVDDDPRSVDRLLAAYDSLAGAAAGLPPHRAVDGAELAARVPMLDRPEAGGGRGGFEYHEAQTDDARLTLAVLREAIGRGALVIGHVALTRLDAVGGTVMLELGDRLGRASLSARATTAVLAVGPWLPALARRLRLPEAPLRPAKGIHVVLRQTLPALEAALALRHPADGRPIWLVPWNGHLLLGTTDAPSAADDPASARATAREVAYVLAGLRRFLPEWKPEVTAAWAGVRPLWGGEDRTGETVDLSREDRYLELADGVIGVAGGKLTTFRRLACGVMDLVDHRRGRTGGAPSFPRLTETLALVEGGSPPLVEGMPFGARHLRAAAGEMAATLDDVLTQRLGISLVRPGLAAREAPKWAEEVGAVLGWTRQERVAQVAAYRLGLARFRAPANS